MKLVDFGIAKDAVASFKATSTGAFLGTPLYMSPEQVLSPREVGPASDLYSLAVLTYECLAGAPPFTGETLGALSVAITRGEYAPISTVAPQLHPALDVWFAKALAARPAERFQSAREMASAFLHASSGQSVSDASRGLGELLPPHSPSSGGERTTWSSIRSSTITPVGWIGLALLPVVAAFAVGWFGWLALAGPAAAAIVGALVRAPPLAASETVPSPPRGENAAVTASAPRDAAVDPSETPVVSTPLLGSANAPPKSAPRLPAPRSRKDRGF